MFQEDLHVPPALTNPQIQTQTQSRASNLTLTEAACVTFSAITSWESQPIEPCYPVFGRLKKEAALPPAQVTPLTTDVSESYLRGFYRSPATRRICYLSIADRLFQPELPPLSRSCPAWHFQFCLECDKSWNAFASYRFAKWKITQRESVCWRGRSVPRQERVMRQVYASRKWRRKTVRRATHVELIGWSLFSSSPLSCSDLRRSTLYA